MDFGVFALISLFYTFLGIRVGIQVFRNWKSLFDDRFTMEDRALITQASFFLLVPFSVALHELGHAVAIWSYGGEVIDFGFYFYAGFVAYREPFNAAQQTVVAVAGVFVNLLLCGFAIGLVAFKRPPFRAPINELFVQFALISGINAFIFYPLLDFATGLGGDFSQMYSFDAPVLSSIILIAHVAIVLGGIWAWRNSAVQAHVARLTGLPAGANRAVFGGYRAGNQPRRPVGVAMHDGGGEDARLREVFPKNTPLGTALTTISEAGQRVATGWGQPVQYALAPVMTTTASGPRASGIGLVLAWQSPDDKRTRRVMARYLPATGLAVSGQSGGQPGDDGPAQSSAITTVPDLPEMDQLVLTLRLAMEEVERWQVVSITH